MCSTWPGRSVRTVPISFKGANDRTARTTTQTHVRKRSDVLRRPARIWYKIGILVNLTRPILPSRVRRPAQRISARSHVRPSRVYAIHLWPQRKYVRWSPTLATCLASAATGGFVDNASRCQQPARPTTTEAVNRCATKSGHIDASATVRSGRPSQFSDLCTTLGYPLPSPRRTSSIRKGRSKFAIVGTPLKLTRTGKLFFIMLLCS